MSAASAAPRLPVCDLHLDTVLEIQAGVDLARGNPEGHVDLARMSEGGAGLLAFACYVSTVLPHGRVFREACDLLDLVSLTCRRFPDDLEQVDTAAEAEAAVTSGRVAILPAVENGHAIECDLGKLEALRQRGARYLTLTHSRHLEWAASSGEDGAGPGGLTAFGREVVRAMESLGMIVDVSHVHEGTFWDVARMAKRPFIASHSCASALCPLPRNLTDDQVRAVAASGGMVGLNFFPGFLDPAFFAHGAEALQGLWTELQRIEVECADDPVRRVAESHRLQQGLLASRGPARADLDTVLAHLLHLVEVAGADHVGIGSDFDGVPELPRGVPDCSVYPRILEGLVRAGLDEETVRKIAWGNFLRVLRATEA
jgi:membrane dipeptidase